MHLTPPLSSLLLLFSLSSFALAFTVPSSLFDRENTRCDWVPEGSTCSTTTEFGLYACSQDLTSIVSICTVPISADSTSMSLLFGDSVRTKADCAGWCDRSRATPRASGCLRRSAGLRVVTARGRRRRSVREGSVVVVCFGGFVFEEPDG